MNSRCALVGYVCSPFELSGFSPTWAENTRFWNAWLPQGDSDGEDKIKSESSANILQHTEKL